MDNNFLDILRGEKLSSVIFVMDYLQLDFDGNRFTLNIWPSVKVDNTLYFFEDQFYRNKLCSLIGRHISQTTLKKGESLLLSFDNGDSIVTSLDPNNPEIITPEIVVFYDVKDRIYILD